MGVPPPPRPPRRSIASVLFITTQQSGAPKQNSRPTTSGTKRTSEVSWQCPLLGEQRKTYARIELFSFCWTHLGHAARADEMRALGDHALDDNVWCFGRKHRT